ncbi:unnamed protein product [Rotaria magnacalcarata]|uniref:Uncharacterized protein n=1 Tax=Rotaria magnacalcarata TaxID=392030 RepID=A0A816QNW4_9BILA|nr:unnamed protein product [Rotaria magnacalcarata]CAF3865625.1 unnamed protein product [Rotaria magnacalcarata]CAF3912406.1 unnamed protein product [Rotaria magnacalcarata]CAF3959651.1 unnamed protein product [Rotaria magnacalcarata]
MMNKAKVMRWYQWTTVGGRVEKNISQENVDDTTVVCQMDYAENYTLQDQDQIQSAHWSKKQVSIFTAYTWMGGSGGDDYSFGFVSN